MNKELEKFIIEHEGCDPYAVALEKDRYPGIDISLAAKCIAARSIIRKKVPSWYSFPSLVYPSMTSIEQCSSEATARYKQRFMEGCRKMADITGGMGVDTYFLSLKASDADYYEKDRTLCEAARHNFHELGINNINVINENISVTNIQSIKTGYYDFIYIDPSRRDMHGKRVYSIKDCSPDISVLVPELRKCCGRILVKISPMEDISEILRTVSGITEIHTTGYDSECKEMLLLVGSGESGGCMLTAYDIDCGTGISFTLSEEKSAATEFGYPEPGCFLYEPSPAILKAGAFKTVANTYGIAKIAANTHLYVSDRRMDNFPGKTYRIIECRRFNKRNAADLRKKYGKASVTARNFPLGSAGLKKLLDTAESDTLHIFGTTAQNGERLLVACEVTRRALP